MDKRKGRMNNDGPMELGHEPVPGYRAVFYVVVAVGILYLLGVFVLWPH